MILPTTTNFYNHLIDFHNKVSTLPLFIRDHFKLLPGSYCSSSQLSTAQAGKWDSEQCIYQSENEVACNDHKHSIESQICARKDIFVSPEHRRASGMLDEDESLRTNLHGKGPIPRSRTQSHSDRLGGFADGFNW